MKKNPEYVIRFLFNGRFDEIVTKATSFLEARKSAKWYKQHGATHMCIGYYENEEEIHRWEFINGDWEQYV